MKSAHEQSRTAADWCEPRVVEVGDRDAGSILPQSDGAPTLYVASTPTALDAILPRIREQDDVTLAGESTASVAARLDRARGQRLPLTLVFLDIDDFREFNKQHGHPTGDHVLRRFVEIVKQNIRESDWLARYGGEEFCLVMPLPPEAAHHVAERIRNAVREERMTSLDGRDIAVTVSIGLVSFDASRDSTAELFVQRASRANRVAKDMGKDRVARA